MVETKEVLLIAVLAILVFNFTPGFTGQIVTASNLVCKTNADCPTGDTCQQVTKYVCVKDPITTTTQVPATTQTVPTCTDGIKNGQETDKDCGGPTCQKCAFKRACSVNTDCKSSLCENGVCLNANYFGSNCRDAQQTYTFCFAIACNNQATANSACTKGGIENGCPRFDVIAGRTVSGQAQGSRTLTVQCTGSLGTFGQQ